MTLRPRLDDDLAREVRRIAALPFKVVFLGFTGVGAMIGIDVFYKHQLSPVAWIAVTAVAVLTLPLVAVLRAQSRLWDLWAREQQARREPDQPSLPPKRPTTRPRTGRQPALADEGRSRARLTPVPQDPPKEASRS